MALNSFVVTKQGRGRVWDERGAAGNALEYYGGLAVLEGTFQKHYEAYRWRLKAMLREGPDDLKAQDGTPLTSSVTFTDQRGDRPGSTVRLRAVWPSEWFQQ